MEEKGNTEWYGRAPYTRRDKNELTLLLQIICFCQLMLLAFNFYAAYAIWDLRSDLQEIERESKVLMEMLKIK